MVSQIISRRLRFLPLFFIVLLGFPNAGYTSEDNTEPNSAQTSYVVIGAFAYQNNAIRFTAYAREQSLDANYALNPDRNLYYVYVFSSPNVTEAIQEVRRVRAIAGFGDAWVYQGSLGESTISTPTVKTYQEEDIEQIDEAYEPEETGAEPSEEEEFLEQEEELVMEESEPEIAEEVSENRIDKREGYYYLYFNAINKKTLKEVKGNIKILDLERIKEIGQGKTHEIVELRDPNNGTRRIKLISDIFGFREIQHEVDLDDPVNDTTKAYTSVVGDSIIVDFELQRFKKGDVIVMYNVYFFIDAAIMKPESVYELNSFLDMLTENQNLKVMIHGHTNGNSHGKIIHLNPDDKNFFNINANHQETVGSAKKLSLFRAEAIKEWMLQQGISEDRIEVKGWGGKRMLYDKFDPLAHKNVRVEVEILAD
ncbi:OmpA family protein [Fulvivirga ulvae]|uniref:OmpA family protein n=1 Tax=Fulvivirga ulvae TaxID=2904245 RepID=UPI001F446258|nr:OmpA family protein [Fulvivirga ulvae]UII32881.1 OmpA family protein [Fulvivirga ulvae]